MSAPVWLRDENVADYANGDASPSHRSRLGYNAGLMTSDILLGVLDFVVLFIAAAVSTVVYMHSPDAVPVDTDPFDHAPWVAGVLAPFILYDRRFGTFAHRRTRDFVGPFAVRFTSLAVVVLTVGAVTQSLHRYPVMWLVVWFVNSLVLMLLSRALLATVVRSLQRRGAITETIAVVGAGPVADRLMHALRQDWPDTMELLGVFDDRFARGDGAVAPIGNLAQLIELGKTRKIDWILLTLPPTAEHRLLAIVKRLMSLSAPIGLCPQNVGSTLPYPLVAYAADTVPVSLLAAPPVTRWDAFVRRAEDVLPRWIVTFVLGPLKPLVTMLAGGRRQGTPASLLRFDYHDTRRFPNKAAAFGEGGSGHASAQNVDHIIRLNERAAFRAAKCGGQLRTPPPFSVEHRTFEQS